MTEPHIAGAGPGVDAVRTLQKVHLLVEANQFETAAALAGAYLAAHPDDPEALVAIGEAQKGLGRLDGAIAAFHRALAVAPGHYTATSMLAFAYGSAGRHPEAVQCARALVRAHPDVWGSHLTLAAVAVGTKDRRLTREAYAAAYRAVQLAPQEPENHVVLGLAARSLGDLETARRANEEALRLDPNNSSALNNRGTVMGRQRGKWAAEVDTYARAAALDPQDGVARYNLEVTAYNALSRTGWLIVVPALIAIVGSAIAARPGGGVAAAIAVGLQLAFWGGWAYSGYRRIPKGRLRMLGRVARGSGPIRAVAASLALVAAATVAVIPLAMVAPGIGAVVLPIVLLRRLVEVASRIALARRHPDRIVRPG